MNLGICLFLNCLGGWIWESPLSCILDLGEFGTRFFWSGRLVRLGFGWFVELLLGGFTIRFCFFKRLGGYENRFVFDVAWWSGAVGFACFFDWLGGSGPQGVLASSSEEPRCSPMYVLVGLLNHSFACFVSAAQGCLGRRIYMGSGLGFRVYGL